MKVMYQSERDHVYQACSSGKSSAHDWTLYHARQFKRHNMGAHMCVGRCKATLCQANYDGKCVTNGIAPEIPHVWAMQA